MSTPYVHRLVTILLAGTAVPLSAQHRPSWRLVADNDYFNFWQPVRQRPDKEYTQGIHLTRSFRPRRSLPRWLPGHLGCAGGAPDCPWVTMALSQEIYTPTHDSENLQPGERPYAGWLAVSASVERHRASQMAELKVTVGITGPLSLAEFAQTRIHRLLGYRKPLGWAGQIPTEPGLGVEYRRADQLLRVGGESGLGMRVGALTGGRLGTFAVDGSAGLHVTLGLAPSAPRPVDLSPRTQRVSLHVSGSFRLDGVLRNEFLQGTLFRSSPGVPVRHLVPEGSVGVQVRLGRVALGWNAVRRGREYPTADGGHTYSSLTVALLP